jgi:hypothetical protein
VIFEASLATESHTGLVRSEFTMRSVERAKFKRSAIAEIRAAMRASSVGASDMHVALAESYLRQCATCVEPVTGECAGCLVLNICLRPALAGDLARRRKFATQHLQPEPIRRAS